MPDRLFESAFDHAAIGMALVAPDGHWLRVNRSICQLVGYSEEELLALTFQDITHPDDLETDLAYVQQMLRGEIESYQMEKRYRHRNGQTVWVLLSVSLVRSADGQPRFFISQIQDIMGRKAAEAAAAEAHAELRESAELVRRLRESFVTVCAWTQRVRLDGQWEPLAEFLIRRLGVQVSHGISTEAVAQFRGNLPPAPRPPSGSAISRPSPSPP